MDITVRCAFAIAAVATSSGFLFKTDCPAPSPCTCSPNYIYCQSKHFTDVPAFKNTSTLMIRTWYLHLESNSISALKANAFAKLATVSDGHRIYMNLNNNNLTDAGVDVNAFNGISKMVYYLNVDDNKLTHLPAAFAKLTNLNSLHIQNNRLMTLDTNVLLKIGHTLRHLYVSLTRLVTWPETLQYLRVLEYLYVYDYKHVIPYNAFKGFLATLQDLEFHNTVFTQLPDAVCSLGHLDSITIAGDINYTSGVHVKCFPEMKSVTKLVFQNVKLESFPEVFDTFPSLQSLKIERSYVSFIDGSELPINTALTQFQMSYCNLTSFPGAINRFHKLRSCDLHNNEIHTLERDSIGNYPYLTSLNLNYNPTIFISKNTFDNLPALQHIYLRGTNLVSIPQAIATLPGLVHIDMRNNEILCDCSLAWLRRLLSNTSMTILGTCGHSSEFLINYVYNNVTSSCP